MSKSRAARINRVAIGKVLKAAREAQGRGWTVLGVAVMVGIDQHTLDRIEKGETNPRFRTLRDVILTVGADPRTAWAAACQERGPRS